MLHHSLDGAWVLHGPAPYESVPAHVPGCVHLDLMAAGLLKDLNYRDQEKDQNFIGETDWRYSRAFDVTPELLAHERVLLRCGGLDTLATIRVNDAMVGYADNMFRTWEFDVKPFLLPGHNTIEVFFAAPMPWLRQTEAEKGLLFAWSIGEHRLNAGAWLRKEPCNFGWDWGPRTVTSGIWRTIELVGFSTARLDDVRVLQDHSTLGQVTLTIEGAVEQLQASELTADVALIAAWAIRRRSVGRGAGRPFPRRTGCDGPRTVVDERPGRATALHRLGTPGRGPRSNSTRGRGASACARSRWNATRTNGASPSSSPDQRRAVLRQGRELDSRRSVLGASCRRTSTSRFCRRPRMRI